MACLWLAHAVFACSKSDDTGDNSGWVGATPLDEALTNGKPTVAEFGAATCIPCKRMKPVLEELIAEHGDKLNLSFTDVRIHTNIATKYKIVLCRHRYSLTAAARRYPGMSDSGPRRISWLI